MKLWRLQIEGPWKSPETFDLSRSRKIQLGDDARNEICLESAKVPSRHPVLYYRFGKLILRLTDEVSPSLEGQYSQKKRWKTKLYEGYEYEISGPCQWQIENLKFSLFKAPKVALSSSQAYYEPGARKHAWQSVGLSTAAHATALLLLALIAWFSQDTKEELSVEKLDIAHLDEILKEPELEEEVIEPEPVEPESRPEPEQAEGPSSGPEEEPIAQASKEEKSQNTPAEPTQPAAEEVSQEPKVPPEETQEEPSRGLLAVKRTNNQSNAQRRIERPQSIDRISASDRAREPDPEARASDNGNEAIQLASLDRNTRHDGYESGALSGQVQGSSRGQSVKLVRREVEIRGGLDEAIIREIIEERLSEVRYCYENSLLQDRNVQGKIQASWTIQADGSVTNLESTSNDIDKEHLHSCLKERIHAWSFPEPKGGGVVHVKYPFVFNSFGS